MKVLAIDTSSAAASCALLEANRPIAEFYTDAKLTHSQTIMPMVNALFECSHSKLEDVDLFAVSTGPGSFTGLRIGVAAVKGMAQVLEKPCFAVSTLEGLAYNLYDRSGLACAVMDARCGQVYTALFELDNHMQRLTPDEAIMAEELAERLSGQKKPVTLVGDGIALMQNTFMDKYPALPQLKAPTPCLRLQRAYSIGLAAWIKVQCKKPTISAAELVPEYLKLPQAQRELLEKQQKMR